MHLFLSPFSSPSPSLFPIHLLTAKLPVPFAVGCLRYAGYNLNLPFAELHMLRACEPSVHSDRQQITNVIRRFPYLVSSACLAYGGFRLPG